MSDKSDHANAQVAPPSTRELEKKVRRLDTQIKTYRDISSCVKFSLASQKRVAVISLLAAVPYKYREADYESQIDRAAERMSVETRGYRAHYNGSRLIRVSKKS